MVANLKGESLKYWDSVKRGDPADGFMSPYSEYDPNAPENSEGGIAVWKAKNNAGRRVASGVYIYVIKTDSQTKVGKIVVIW